MADRYLITGASRGVGEALARALVARGDAVVGWSRTGVGTDMPGYRDMRVDVTDAAAVAASFATLRSGGELPDVVVLGAGASSAAPALLQDPTQFAQVMDVNAGGAFLVAREALRAMLRARQGRIIFISSINTRLHSAGGVAYNASKAAVEEMTRTLARECGTADITVNALGLSLVEGDGMAAALTDAEVARKGALMAKPEPIGADELVHAVDFLASPGARSITGQVIHFGGVV